MELIDEITSFVDNELKDSAIVERLQKLIAINQDLRREYWIQKSIKNLLSARLSDCKTPSCLCDKLKSKLCIEIKNTSSNKEA